MMKEGKLLETTGLKLVGFLLIIVVVGFTAQGKEKAKVKAFPGTVGTLAWSFPKPGWEMRASPAVADIDADPYLEVVIPAVNPGSGDYKVYCMCGNNNTVEWEFNLGGVTESTPAIGDVDGDGAMEVVLGCQDDKVYCINGSTGESEWNYTAGANVDHPVAIADIDTDGIAEVIAVTGSDLHVITGTNGSWEWYYNGSSTITTPSIGDLDLDGDIELVVPCMDMSVYCIRGDNGMVKWQNSNAMASFKAPASLGDLNGDGIIDAVTGSGDGNLHAFSGNNGTELWHCNIGDIDTNPSVMGDIDGDALMDIVVSTGSTVRCVNGNNGTIKWSHATTSPFHATPALGDVDGDGEVEVMSAYYRFLICLDSKGDREWNYTLVEWDSFRWDISLADVDVDGNVEILIVKQEGTLYCFRGREDDNLEPGPWVCAYSSPRHDSFLEPASIPVLSGGIVNTTSGNQSTNFQFNVTYTDGDNHAPSFVNLLLNSTRMPMSKVDPSDVDYTDGCQYTWSGYLQPAQYTYSFEGSNYLPGNASLAGGNIDVQEVNVFSPILTNTTVSPNYGYLNQTTFTFTANYSDADNNAPLHVNLTINGSTFEMNEVDPLDDNYIDGKLYNYSHIFDTKGAYEYHFNASDNANPVSAGPYTDLYVNYTANYNMYLDYYFEWIDATDGWRVENLDFWHVNNAFLPFNFTFYNWTFNEIHVCEYGYVAFEDYYDHLNDPFPTTSNHFMIAPYWEHLRADDPVNVFVKNLTNPNRVVIQWDNVRRATGPEVVGTFQVILHENGEIVINYDEINYLMSPTCGINNGLETRLFNAYSINTSVDDWSVLFTMDEYEHSPTLERPKFAPATGYQDTLYNFSVEYHDADGNYPRYMDVNINGTSHEMEKVNPLDNDYTDGCTYQFLTYLQPVTHEYYYNFSDGVDECITSTFSNVTVDYRNVASPSLTGGNVSPTWGLNDTTIFSFRVNYSDPDNNAPDWVNVTVAGTTYTMYPVDPGDNFYMDGAWFEYNTTLPPGDHEYFFNCSDPEFTASDGLYQDLDVDLFKDWDQVSLQGVRVGLVIFHGEGNPSSRYPAHVSHVTGRGAQVSLIDEYITLKVLENYDVLWFDEFGISRPYLTITDEEIDAIESWVVGGGRIFISGDHHEDLGWWTPAARLAERLGIYFQDGPNGEGIGIPIHAHSVTDGVNNVYWSSPDYVINTGASTPELKMCTGSGLAGTLEMGDGRIGIISEGYILQNDVYDDFLLVHNMLGWVCHEQNHETPGISLEVSPTSGTQDTLVTLNATYIDADGNWPKHVGLYLNGTRYTMNRVNITDYDATNGIMYELLVYLQPGDYQYSMNCTDGLFTNDTGILGTISIGYMNNDAPMVSNLQSECVVNGSTYFHNFSVIYSDADNNAPSAINVTVNGTLHEMVLQDATDTNFMDGAVYACNVSLPFGEFEYHVACHDGATPVNSSTMTGLEVTPFNTGFLHDIVINEIHTPELEEYELLNYGPTRVMSGWQFVVNWSLVPLIYTFPDGFVFPAGSIIVLLERSGLDNQTVLHTRLPVYHAFTSHAYLLLNEEGDCADVVMKHASTVHLPPHATWEKDISLTWAYNGTVYRTDDEDLDRASDFLVDPVKTMGSLNPGQTGMRALRPRLKEPINGTLLEAGTLLFNWTSMHPTAGDLNFTLEIAGDLLFTNLLYSFHGIPELMEFTSTSQMVNLSTGVYYWRIVPRFNEYNGTASKVFELPLWRNIMAPELISGTVNPGSGDQWNMYNFSVVYVDGDNNAPLWVNLTINGTIHQMQKWNGGDSNYTDGCLFVFQTMLQSGNYSFQFSTHDGDFSNVTTGYTINVSKTNLASPTLQFTSVSPVEGVQATNYTFITWFYDPDNNTADYVNITIDGITHVMLQVDPSDINAVDGIQFTWSTTSLTWGQYTYQINASDGENNCTTGSLAGPNVNPFLAGGSTVTLIAPLNASYANFTEISFTWLNSSAPTTTMNYTWQLSTDPGFATVHSEQNVQGLSPVNTSCNHSFGAPAAVYYWRVRPTYGPFNGSWSTNYTLNVIENDVAPVLSGGAVSPVTGTQLEEYEFSILYTDADNNEPIGINVTINGSVHALDKENIGDNDYTDGCLYVVSLTLAPGNYTYNFTCHDGIFYSTSGIYLGPEVSFINLNPPVLSNGGVIPITGFNGSTIFTYQVIYTDVENIAPSFINVTIDGVPHAMVKMVSIDNDYTDGCVYIHETVLDVGNHEYWFNCSDGSLEAGFGPFSGPVVVPMEQYYMVPDYSGYRWFDVLGTGSRLSMNGVDDGIEYIPLPFNFTLYDQTVNGIYACSNGFISLSDYASYINEPFPTINAPYMIAPYWDDLMCESPCNIWVASFSSPRCTVIEFHDYRTLGSTLVGSFQVALFPDGAIMMNYDYLDYAMGYTCGLNHGTGSGLHNQFSGLNSSIDDFSILFTKNQVFATGLDDFSVAQNTTNVNITWQLHAVDGPGHYQVLRDGTSMGGWQSWTGSGDDIVVPVNTNLGTGPWNYTIVYNDSTGRVGIQDTVNVLVESIPVVSSSPAPVNTTQYAIGVALEWIIIDSAGSGHFTLHVNGTPHATYTNQPWVSEDPIIIPVDTSVTAGEYIYTLVYWNDHGNHGANSSVQVTITPGSPDSGFNILEFLKEYWYLPVLAIGAVAGVAGIVAKRKKGVKPSKKTSKVGEKSAPHASIKTGKKENAGAYVDASGLNTQVHESKGAGERTQGTGEHTAGMASTGGLKPRPVLFHCPSCNKDYPIESPDFTSWYSCPSCAGALQFLKECPHCEEHMVITRNYMDSYKGQVISCPRCNGKVQL